MLTPRSHLAVKRGVYYYRRKLPSPHGGDVAVSLGTRGFREAQHLATLANSAFDHFFRSSPRMTDIQQLLRQHLSEVLREDVMSSNRIARYAPLLLRLVLGSLFIAHLYWKFAILPGGLSQWWAGFASSGYPWFVPWYVFSAELAGALLLIPGIYAGWVSLYALPMMLGAAQFWAVRKGFYFTGSGAELPLVWSLLLILQAMLGDGPYQLRASWASAA